LENRVAGGHRHHPTLRPDQDDGAELSGLQRIGENPANVPELADDSEADSTDEQP
jgi:hypothetical protein